MCVPYMRAHQIHGLLVVVLQLMDDDCTTSESPAQASTQLRSSCRCFLNFSLTNNNSQLPDHLPSTEKTQSKSSCHQGLYDNHFHINLR